MEDVKSKGALMLRFLIMIFYGTIVFSQSAIDLKNEAMKNLNQFNPSNTIPHYNPHPSEENIHPENQADISYLKSLGHQRLAKDLDARFIYENEGQRIKIAENEKDKLLQDAEKIIEHAEENIYQQCHDEKVPCDEKKTDHICHETAIYKTFSCEKTLNVVLRKKQHPFLKRWVKPNISISLTECLNNKSENRCEVTRLIQLSSECKHLVFHVRNLSGTDMEVSKYPSCQDPTFIFKSRTGVKAAVIVELDVQELSEEDRWQQSPCDFQNQYFCSAKADEHCVEGPLSKVIDGVTIHRNCWKQAQDFDCAASSESNCSIWEDKGCANLSAICLRPRQEGRCDEIQRTYQCIERTCYPDKRVCTKTLPCVDGSCDQTKNEESDDIQEGISRLGAVAGSVEEVSNQQSISSNVEVFKGERRACSKLPLGVRDCCIGEGFLEGVFHCPADLRELQRAKLEGRATLVGTYDEDLGLKKIYVYCVFPTKLAGILQIQGRLGQLGIGFGEPKKPLCDSGFKASFLERIDFKRLDLSGIVDEFKNKAKFKTLEEIENETKNHVNALHDKEQAHD